MRIGEKIRLLIAEPWDFESPSGPNEVRGEVLETRIGKYGRIYLVKVKDVFDIDRLTVEYMVLSYRDIDVSHSGFNIGYIPSDRVAHFQTLSNTELQECLKFIMIGSI
jgi:hypothetical protein